jgi:hypothetical protein
MAMLTWLLLKIVRKMQKFIMIQNIYLKIKTKIYKLMHVTLSSLQNEAALCPGSVGIK